MQVIMNAILSGIRAAKPTLLLLLPIQFELVPAF